MFQAHYMTKKLLFCEYFPLSQKKYTPTRIFFVKKQKHPHTFSAKSVRMLNFLLAAFISLPKPHARLTPDRHRNDGSRQSTSA